MVGSSGGEAECREKDQTNMRQGASSAAPAGLSFTLLGKVGNDAVEVWPALDRGPDVNHGRQYALWHWAMPASCQSGPQRTPEQRLAELAAKQRQKIVGVPTWISTEARQAEEKNGTVCYDCLGVDPIVFVFSSASYRIAPPDARSHLTHGFPHTKSRNF